jgi:hypothetical protein
MKYFDFFLDKDPIWSFIDLFILVYLVLSILFPIKLKEKAAGISFSELKKRFAWFHFFALIFSFGMMILMTFGLLEILELINKNYQLQGSVYMIKSIDLLYIISIMFSISFSIILIFWFIKLVLGDDYKLYLHYYNLLYKMNAIRVLSIITPLILLLSWLVFYFYVQYGFYVFQDKIVIRTLFSIESNKYKFNEIERLEKRNQFIAPNGDVINRNHYVIYFQDKTSWSSLNETSEADSDSLDSIVFDFIKGKMTTN